jgi:hypothetical protein
MTTQQGFTFDDPDSRTRSGAAYIPDCDEAQTLGGFSWQAGQAPASLAWTARLNPSRPRRAGKRQYRQIAELRVLLRQ